MQQGDQETVKVDPEAEISTPEGADANVTDATDQSLRKPVIDPFDNEQSDPKKSNAMSKFPAFPPQTLHAKS